MTKPFEINIDCLAGPTHHFGGLSFGNIASTVHKGILSNPKKAALQGLEKMKILFDLGIPQIVLPPHPRPALDMLRRLGFEGDDHEVMALGARQAPQLLLQCSSSSAMWAANAATVTPSADSLDKKVHCTCANLAANFHRSIEASYSALIFKKVFFDTAIFSHHPSLPSAAEFFDEGAANHTRFCNDDGKGLHLFVFGKNHTLQTQKYPARQTEQAQIAISRLHKIDPNHLLFAQQNPKAIDAGVFHNDVISTGYRDLFLFHEDAFVDTPNVIETVQQRALHVLGKELTIFEVKRKDLSIKDAVSSYLFNCQIVETTQGYILLAPAECEKMESAKTTLQAIQKQLPITKIIFISLNESMKNGGGPACLRLRMQLTQKEFDTVHKGVIFSEALYHKLKESIQCNYRDQLTMKDLSDPQFLKTTSEAIAQITNILGLSDAIISL